MTLPAFFSTLAFRLIAAGAIVLILIVAVRSCEGSRQRAAQAKQDARSANATAETAKEAAATVIKRADNDATVDELVRDTAKRIDDAATPAEASKAARSAICSMPSYSGDPQCAK